VAIHIYYAPESGEFRVIVGFGVVTAVVMKSIIFCLPPAFTLVSCSAYLFYPEDGSDMLLQNVG
jgi:hypothetical protein